MSHADLTVYSGSTHQADRRLSEVSRVRQYAFTAMLLNGVANSCRVSQWTPDTVDEILIYNKEMPCV